MTEQVLENAKPTFENVIKEVVDAGKCMNCGACSMACTTLATNVISIKEGTIRTVDMDKCEECSLCYVCCPRTSFDGVADVNVVDDRIGNYISIRTYKTALDELKDKYQDGGVVTSILLYLLDNMLIDAVLVIQKDENWIPKPILTNDRNLIIKSAGTVYATTPNFDAFKILKDVDPKILESFGVDIIDHLRVAMVGLPCQMASLKRMEAAEIFPANLIKFKISLFCFENFDHDVLFNYIKKKLKTSPNDIQHMNIKGNMKIKLKSGKELELKPKEFQSLAREGCHWCGDLTGINSDISCGGIGGKLGYTCTITRSDKGSEMINRAVNAGYIEEGPPAKLKLVRKIAGIKIKKQKKE